MTTAPRVFHHVPRPISLSEFKDAVEAACRPRFPTARFARPQRIGMDYNVLTQIPYILT
jgi:tRNA(Ile)-lysidine synthase